MNNFKKAALQKLMDLKIDVAFKKVLGSEPQFFNEILERSSRQKIQRILMQAPALDEGDTLAPLHFLGITRGDKKLHILVNPFNRFDIVKRSIFYATKAYSEQSYNDLHPVIFINLLSYELVNQSDNYHTTYFLQEKQSSIPLPEVFELHFIEYPKLILDFERGKIDLWNDAKARWLLLLAIVDERNNKVFDEIYKELDLISLREDSIRTAFSRWQEVSHVKEEYEMYEERLKQTLEAERDVREAKRREEVAFAKGVKQQQIEIAKKMLAEQLDIQSIAKITGLSLKEIQELI